MDEMIQIYIYHRCVVRMNFKPHNTQQPRENKTRMVFVHEYRI